MNEINARASILRSGIEIGTLNIINGNVFYDSLSKVKRGAKLVCNDEFNMKNGIEFNMITDKIQIIHIENNVENSLGIFNVISSPKSIDGKISTFEFELYDDSMIIEQNEIGERLFLKGGIKYLDAISQILTKLNLTKVITDDSNLTLLSDREYSIGTNQLTIINELLSEINFDDLHIDFNGYIHLTKKSTNTNTPNWIYRENNASNIYPEVKQNLDLYKVPNIFIGFVSNPDVELFYFKKVNDLINSSISTVNRGIEITKTYNLNNIGSQEELETFINDEYNNSLQQTETVNFKTAIQPFHEFKDVIQLDTEEIKELYIETAWSITLGYNGSMTHSAERKVFI